jgi:putative membrane-bound dehydrogenase-like protein
VSHRIAAFLLLLSLVPSATAQQPLPRVPDGFKVELILQAPDVEAPTALCVAPNGDVYFAEDPMDMAGPPTKNLDRIWLLKGGDPKRRVLFADKLWAVMGLELVNDKLYVVHAPYVSVFTLDAEGKAKVRQDLFTDLGPPVAGLPSFNDHIPSGIRMGMDGWLYVSIGDKGIPKMTRKEKDQGSVHVAEGRWRRSPDGHHISLEGGGVIRFRPDGSGLEVFASGTRNHLDVPLDEYDRIFVRDNTDDGDGWNTRFMYLPAGGFLGYPWAFKQRPNEVLPMIHDFGGGSPCGGWVYADDGLPATYRGRVFHCEWGKGKVLAVRVAPDGAGFKYVDEIKFLDPEGTSVKDFRPFTLRPTADGRGFYVTDWGFSGWLQKVKAGRIYKVTYVRDDVKPAPRVQGDTVEELLAGLAHPAHSERLRVQRRLEEKAQRGEERAVLLNGISGLLLSGRHVPTAAKPHVLWLLCNLGEKEFANRAAWALLRDHDPAVRAEAARVLGQLGRATELVGVLNDPEPRVRLQAAVGLARGPWGTQGALDLADRLANHEETDPYVRHALVKAYRVQPEARAVLLKRLLKSPRPCNLDLAFQTVVEQFDLDDVRFLADLLSGLEDATLRRRIVETLARMHHDRKPYAGTWWGTQPEQQRPPARIVNWEGTPLVRQVLLRGLSDIDRTVRKAAVVGLLDMRDPITFDPLHARFVAEKDEEMRRDLVQAIAGLRTVEAATFLSAIATAADRSVALRLEACAGLEKAGHSGAVDTFIDLAAVSVAALQARALEALGNLKAKKGLPACEKGLKHPAAAVRQAAAGALAKIGEAGTVPALLPLLADRDSDVRTAVIQALGTFKARAAVPALVQAAADEATQFEAVKALAAMPDARALPAYLTGLASKNADLRKACRQALTAVRAEALPTLEQLVQRKEVRAEVLPELRAIYSTAIPVEHWRIIGPFLNDGKAYPPETEQKFDAVYPGCDQQVKWQEVRANLRDHGRLDLAARFQPNTDVVAYGYAEVDSAAARDAELVVGSDDSIIIWLNGQKVHEFLGDRGWAPDQEKVAVKLAAGKNRLLIKCGNHSGPWEYSVAVTEESDRYAFLKGGGQRYDLEAFRAFARKNPGDAGRGQKLFADLKGLACVKCHAVNGQGGQVGPDLAGIGLKYKREELMTSILEPSKVIAQGYETIVLTTTRGQVLTGVFKGESADAVNLVDAEGKPHTITKKEIEERSFSQVSTMPNGLNEGMTLQDFADVIAFLEARREEKLPTRK